MNTLKLQQAQAQFLQRYPGGFQDPEMQAIARKHKVEQMVSLARERFAKARFKDPDGIVEDLVKIVSRSSLVSVFEKPQFRDWARALAPKGRAALAEATRQRLHGKQQRGFEAMVELLVPAKLAKWPLLTVVPNYFSPDTEVFIKPTTAKGVIAYFELEGLVYKPRPSWEFYQAYREAILRMRAAVAPSLSPNNAAFCGFLMMQSSG